MIWDAFMFNDELDMLECRLTELDAAVDRFVLVEADVTHTNQPKASHYLEHRERFAAWEDRIVRVWATGLPAGPDAWSREHAQREWIIAALDNADDADLLMQSDIDEIPHPDLIRGIRTTGYLSFEQRYYSFAVDWQMPLRWYGTTAAPAGLARQGLQRMRERRNAAPIIPDGGWHLSWLGGPERTLEKLGTSPHPEMVDETRAGIESGAYLNGGATMSVFGNVAMIPVDVDDTWPRYIAERRCPNSWFRPR